IIIILFFSSQLLVLEHLPPVELQQELEVSVSEARPEALQPWRHPLGHLLVHLPRQCPVQVQVLASGQIPANQPRHRLDLVHLLAAHLEAFCWALDLALHLAICTPSYFNNENDEVLRKWNQLQAFWGSGKGYYAPNMPPVEFTAENPYCRFKVVCYARIPNYRNENGIVQIILGKGVSAVEPHKQQIVSTLSSIFGGAEVVIDEVFNADVPDKTNIRFYVQQPLPNGEKQRAAAADVSRHMLGPAYAQSLKNLCIEQVTPMLMLTEVQMKEYLDTPQRGIDPALWEQGKRENPNPHKFVPVVKVGFQELQQQFKYQEEHAANLQSSMNNIMDEITQLRHKQTMVKAAIQNAKWKQASLTRRVLKLVSAQEVERKRGVPLDQTEEQIRMRLEDLYLQLMQPTQYRGCLNELMAQMSVKPGSCRGGPRYGLISDKERDVSQYVSLQHNALQAVVVVLKEDMQVVDSMIEEIQRKS
ncbi:Nucleoporin p54-like, partial [Homarus americanus]